MDMDGVPGHCHALHKDRRDQFAVNLWSSYRLIFVPDHDPVPLKPDGGLDWAAVTTVLIIEVADTHT